MQADPRQTETADEEYTLPNVEALLAGTLALMTGYAQSAPDCPHRECMARKLVSHLMCLSSHPQLSPQMQAMLSNLRTRWQLQLENGASSPLEHRTPTALWHAAPGAVH